MFGIYSFGSGYFGDGPSDTTTVIPPVVSTGRGGLILKPTRKKKPVSRITTEIAPPKKPKRVAVVKTYVPKPQEPEEVRISIRATGTIHFGSLALLHRQIKVSARANIGFEPSARVVLAKRVKTNSSFNINGVSQVRRLQIDNSAAYLIAVQMLLKPNN